MSFLDYMYALVMNRMATFLIRGERGRINQVYCTKTKIRVLYKYMTVRQTIRAHLHRARYRAAECNASASTMNPH